jgi:serine/threonine protein kinase
MSADLGLLGALPLICSHRSTLNPPCSLAALPRTHIASSLDPWPSISPQAKSLLLAMLTRDPAARPTARELLQHPWLRPDGASTVAGSSPAGSCWGGGEGKGSSASFMTSDQEEGGGGNGGEAGGAPPPEMLTRIRSFANMDRLKKHAALVSGGGLFHD